MDIGYQLQLLLDEKGMKQKELARSLNLAASTINGYIKNKRQPDADTLIQLAAYFNTSTDYIYGVTPLKELPVFPYNAEERHLVDLYRATPEDKRPLFIEIGQIISNH